MFFIATHQRKNSYQMFRREEHLSMDVKMFCQVYNNINTKTHREHFLTPSNLKGFQPFGMQTDGNEPPSTSTLSFIVTASHESGDMKD